jgi:hypothetical protein
MKTSDLYCYNLVTPKHCDGRHIPLTAENNFPTDRREEDATRKRGPQQCGIPDSSLKLLISVQRLPAAISAATAAAISTVAVPASATAPTATTTARPAAAAVAASATTSARPATATTATLTRRTSFIDDNVAAHEIVAVQSLDGALGFLVAIDLDKSEPAGLTRETVAHQGDIRRGDSRLRE